MGRSHRVAVGTVVMLIALLSSTLLDRHIATAQSDCASMFYVAKKIRTGRHTGINSMTAVGDDVWAVGSYTSGGDDHSFLIKWDGDSWNWLPVPMPGRGSYYFSGIDAAGPDDIWLAGTHSRFPNNDPVVFRWTAGEWTEMEVPQPEHSGNLWDIEVITSTDVWAVGSWDEPEPSPTLNPLAYHWDGTGWTRRDPPPRPRDYIELTDVEASDPNHVWVTGNGGQNQYVVEWNGAEWIRHEFRDYRHGFPRVSGLDVISENEVWFAGTIENVRYRAQVWRWDGTEFHETSTFDPRGHEFLSDILMTSDGGYAVGNETRRRFNEALVIAWNGSEWAKVTAERPGSESFLSTLVATSDGTVWASGAYDARSGDQVAMIQRSCSPVA